MLRAFIFPALSSGAVGTGCAFSESHACLAEPSCAWLFLKGRCANLTEAALSPPKCCAAASPAAGGGTGPCAHRTLEEGEGRCSTTAHRNQLKSSGQPGESFSLEHAQRMAHFAGASYCSPAKVRNWTCGVHCDALKDVVADHTSFVHNQTYWLGGLVAWDPKQQAVVVAFRGTVGTSVEDWLADFSYGTVQPFPAYPEAAIHRGFWGAWKTLKNGVVQAIDGMLEDHPGSPVHLTGHSLGAGIANAAALDLKVHRGVRTTLVDFGSPRVGNLEYVHAMAREVPSRWRLTHGKDVVPHLPPQAFGFYHAPTEVFFPSQGMNVTHVVCDGSGEDPLCANQCTWSFTGCSSMADHLIYAGIAIGTNFCEVPAESQGLNEVMGNVV